jgi:hypothetical protein
MTLRFIDVSPFLRFNLEGAGRIPSVLVPSSTLSVVRALSHQVNGWINAVHVTSF